MFVYLQNINGIADFMLPAKKVDKKIEEEKVFLPLFLLAHCSKLTAHKTLL